MQGKLNYPPGIALFQYFFMSFGRYSEAAIFFAQGIFVFSAVAPIFDFVGKKLIRVLVFALAIGTALVYFGPGFLSMTNDHIIGVTFAIAVLSNYFILKTNKSKLLLIPIVFCLPLIKTTGLLLSLAIIIVVVIEMLAINFGLIKKKKFGKKNILKSVGVLLLLAFFTLIPIKSWDFYIQKQGMEPTPMPAISKLMKSFSPEATQREKTVLKNFKKDLIDRPINTQDGEVKSNVALYKMYLNIIKKTNQPAMGTFTWSLIFCALFGLLICCQETKDKIITSSRLLSMLIGLVIFVFFHLIAYLYFFSDYEAVKLASMDRYFCAYFLGLSLIFIGSAAVFMKENPAKAKIFGLITGTFLVYLLVFHTPMLARLVVTPKMMAASTELVREKTRPFSNEINANTEVGSKIWVIYQNTNGWECMMMRYDIVPRIMNGGSGNWSLGDKYGPSDVWTNSMDKATWSSQLLDEKYDYVFLAYADENFWNYHSSIFEDSIAAKNHKLFKVTEKNGSAILVAK